jgi:NAD(P)-dependent dehydrogenase (short-subunit alcohol dehydrogenase family)
VARWTPDDIPDLSDRRAVVTGANSGLGLQTALGLARKKANVTLAVRDEGRGTAAAKRIRDEVPGATVDVRVLDLGSLDSIRAFATAFDEPLDILVNNAGVMAPPRRETADGFELQLGTNHLGHFALTGLLLDRLKQTGDPRVVTVSSGAHRMGRMDFDDLMGERNYDAYRRYGQSKLANLLFMLELQRRADAAGLSLRSMAAHPGYAATNLQTTGPSTGHWWRPDNLLYKITNVVIAQSDAAGAQPSLRAATDDLPGGTYLGPSGPGEMRGHPVVVDMAGRARKPDDGRRLWELSTELTGVDYGLPAAGASAVA